MTQSLSSVAMRHRAYARSSFGDARQTWDVMLLTPGSVPNTSA